MTSIRLLHTITFWQMFILYIFHTYKNYHYDFLLEFWNCSCNTNFLHLFLSTYKTHHIYASYYGISTVCSFYRWLFPWLHVKRFQSTEVKEFCLGLRVIGRSVRLSAELSVMLQMLFFTYVEPATLLNTPPWVFFTFFKLYKQHQSAQRITYGNKIKAQHMFV